MARTRSTATNTAAASNGAEASSDAATGNGNGKQRVHVKLATSYASEADVEWPGSERGGHPRNVELRAELAGHLATMTLGSTRRYAVPQDEDGGDKAQETFINTFRSVCDEVHDKAYGVNAVKGTDNVIVRLSNRRAAPKSSK